jgi:hypothetical protein
MPDPVLVILAAFLEVADPFVVAPDSVADFGTEPVEGFQVPSHEADSGSRRQPDQL